MPCAGHRGSLCTTKRGGLFARRVVLLSDRWPPGRDRAIVPDPLARVRAIAMKLPDVEEGTTHGYAAFKIGGKAFAWFPNKKEVEPGSLGIRMSILEREYRIRANPAAFYVTPHYVDYTSVLARVERLSAKELKELLESGYEFMTAAAKAKKKRPSR